MADDEVANECRIQPVDKEAVGSGGVTGHGHGTNAGKDFHFPGHHDIDDGIFPRDAVGAAAHSPQDMRPANRRVKDVAVAALETVAAPEVDEGTGRRSHGGGRAGVITVEVRQQYGGELTAESLDFLEDRSQLDPKPVSTRARRPSSASTR